MMDERKYQGKCLLEVIPCSRENQYKVADSYLAIDNDGKLGHIGHGISWFLNYVTKSGACAFNPIKSNDLMWSPYHNAYFRKVDEEHFRFPVIIGQFYYLIAGVKSVGFFSGDEIVSRCSPEVAMQRESPFY